MRTITATQARIRIQQLVDGVAQSHEPVWITGSSSRAVLVSEENWRSIQETLCLLGIPGMAASIREGLATPIEDCDRTLDW